MSIPYDPDFDSPQKSTSAFEVVNSRTAFIAGLISSVLIIGTLGFFVLLSSLI